MEIRDLYSDKLILATAKIITEEQRKIFRERIKEKKQKAELKEKVDYARHVLASQEMLKNLNSPSSNIKLYKRLKSEYKKLSDEEVISMHQSLIKNRLIDVKNIFENINKGE